MRILITLGTVLASAISALLANGMAAAVANPPCLPTRQDTVWTWPLVDEAGDARWPSVPRGPTGSSDISPTDTGPTSTTGAGPTSTTGAGRAGPTSTSPIGMGPTSPTGPDPTNASPTGPSPTGPTGPTDTNPTGTGPKYTNPTNPTILRPFIPPPHRWDSGHRGVDLAGYVAEPVRAAGPGVVLYAGRLVDRGVVVIGHGLLRTSYEPVSATLAVGASVAVGEQVGTLDPGHCASDPCLHWGLLTGHGHGTTYYDPLLLLGCGEVRLEPVKGAP